MALFTKSFKKTWITKQKFTNHGKKSIPIKNASAMMHFYKNLSPFRPALLGSAFLTGIFIPFDSCATLP